MPTNFATQPGKLGPFLPVHLPGSIQDIRFQRATMPPLGSPPRDPLRRGVLLTELPTPFFVEEEEVPASGLIVSRRTQRTRRTRWYDGRAHLWIGHGRETGRGGANCGLRFDQIDDLPSA